MKTGIFITVRMGSSRLPGKALRLINERPILEYLITRIQHISQSIGDIIVCTTNNSEDQVFDNLTQKLGVSAYHGDPHNIVKRHLDCATTFKLDFIINIDGDDILCNPEYVLKLHSASKLNNDKQVFRTVGLPFGTNIIGYKKEVLEQILMNCDYKAIETGWGSLICDENMFDLYSLTASEDERDNIRLTLDYQEDFLVFKEIIENVFTNENYIPQSEVLKYIKSHPEITLINSHLNETYWNNFYNVQMKERSQNYGD